MGQNSSKTFNDEHFIPSERLFKLSYTVYKSISNGPLETSSVNLSNLLDEYHNNIGVFMQFFYQKFKFNGYNLKPINFNFGYRSIHDIIMDISNNGFPVSNNEFFKDIKIIKSCYKPSLDTIYNFLNQGKLLLAMIILDTDFITDSLKLSHENLKDIATDAVVIVGYDQFNFYIKTNWFKFIVKVENKFINNIKEIWDIDIF
jgi:hypothetical protein